MEEFKARFYDISYRLQEDSGEEVPESLRNQCFALLDQFNDQLQEARDRLEDPHLMDCSWGYIFKEIFPYFMRSRFAERAYFKPKGYAGDFKMMEMISYLQIVMVLLNLIMKLNIITIQQELWFPG